MEDTKLDPAKLCVMTLADVDNQIAATENERSAAAASLARCDGVLFILRFWREKVVKAAEAAKMADAINKAVADAEVPPVAPTTETAAEKPPEAPPPVT